MDNDLGFRIFDDVEGALHPFKHWEVDSEGNMQYLGNTRTQISRDHLLIGNLLTHFMSKDLDKGAVQEFYFAFIQALKNAGYTRMEIDLVNPHNNINVR